MALLRLGRLALLVMVGGDVTRFVADDECQLGLVVDDAHQLPGYIDIAARYGERVFNRAVKRGEMIDLPSVGRTGIGRNPPADSLYISGARTRFGTSELGNDFRMLPGCFLHIALVEIVGPLRLGLRQ